jgi:excisionase family DNA binding protein
MTEILRPSELARTWKVHPRTVVQWIRTGRLPSVQTPGGQYRVLRKEVDAFCKREGFANPTETATDVALFGLRRSLPRTLLSSVKGTPSFRDPLSALSHVTLHPPRAIFLEYAFADAVSMVRALRQAASLARVAIYVFDIPTRQAFEKMKNLGARGLYLKRDRALFAETAARALQLP